MSWEAKVFNLSVETLLYRPDGTLFFSDVMRWYGVHQTIIDWFTASCKTTGGWVIRVPATKGKKYSIKYRTITRDPTDDRVISDTTLLEFDDVSYPNILRFQRWALKELGELVDLFESEHALFQIGDATGIEPPRSHTWAVLKIAWQVLRNKLRREHEDEQDLR